ncbi:hypothetical protein FG167_01970 [Lacinutrix sp. WUR7]|uniref:hypothetical protein n=1 Tax=Lacinutrix sp. WUR7 TaxID=2653681 RepID=UPI00193D2ADF|nr:hypothetical protein [Lacinutrix sp. WUR7]QRM88039.1 hypothetical protein FG167_01970 [Lacinutrix sp. WUR7]
MKNFKLFIVTLVLSGIASSCLVDDEAQTITGNTPYIVGFDTASSTNSYFQDEGVVYKEYPVSLKGSPTGDNYDKDIVINYSIDPSSTAVEGQEFDFVDTSGGLTIPAGSDYALFPLDINTGNFDTETPTELIINITTTTTNTIVSQQYSSLTVKFVGCLATVEANTYNVNVTFTNYDGVVSQYTLPGQTLELTSTPNVYITDTTPPFGPGELAPGYDGYLFEVICGEVFVASQALGGYYGNTVEGNLGSNLPAGTVDSITGDIHIEYNVCYDQCYILVLDYIKQ